MSLRAVVSEDEFGGLNEAFQAEYKKQENGTYILDVSPVDDFALENVRGLKSALNAERENREKLESSMKAFEGIDAQNARASIQKIDELNNLNERHSFEKAKLQDKVNSLSRQLEGDRIDSVATKAIAAQNGNISLLLPHLRSQTRMIEDDGGKQVIQVVDLDGNVRMTGESGKTTRMTIDELVAEMKESDDFSCAFAGTDASGTGAGRGGNGGQVVKNPWKKETFSVSEQYRISKESPTLAAQLEAQAKS